MQVWETWRREGLFDLDCDHEHIGADWREVLSKNIERRLLEWRLEQMESLTRFRGQVQNWARDTLDRPAEPGPLAGSRCDVGGEEKCGTSEVAADALDASSQDVAADVNGGTLQLPAGEDQLETGRTMEHTTLERTHGHEAVTPLDHSLPLSVPLSSDPLDGSTCDGGEEVEKMEEVASRSGEIDKDDERDREEGNRRITRSRAKQPPGFLLGRPFQNLEQVPRIRCTHRKFESGDLHDQIQEASNRFRFPFTLELGGELGHIGRLAKNMLNELPPWHTDKYNLSIDTSPKYDVYQKELLVKVNWCLGISEHQTKCDGVLASMLNCQHVDVQLQIPSGKQRCVQLFGDQAQGPACFHYVRGGMLGYGAVCCDVSPVSGAHSARYDLALYALDTSVSTGTPYPPWFKVLAHRVVQSNPLSLSLSPFSGLSTLHTCTVGAPTRTAVYICRVRRGGSGVPDLHLLGGGSRLRSTCWGGGLVDAPESLG